MKLYSFICSSSFAPGLFAPLIPTLALARLESKIIKKSGKKKIIIIRRNTGVRRKHGEVERLPRM